MLVTILGCTAVIWTPVSAGIPTLVIQLHERNKPKLRQTRYDTEYLVSAARLTGSHLNLPHGKNKTITRNHKHRRAAAKPAACANSLGLSGPNVACDSRRMVHVYRLNVIWFGVLCR